MASLHIPVAFTHEVTVICIIWKHLYHVGLLQHLL